MVNQSLLAVYHTDWILSMNITQVGDPWHESDVEGNQFPQQKNIISTEKEEMERSNWKLAV